MKKEYEVLFTPAKIGTCEIKNRFIMAPMAPTALIEWTMKPGGFNENVHDLIINRAKDGIGLIIPGAIQAYSIANREFLGDHPEAFEGIQELMDEVHSYGSKVFMQISAGLGRNFPMTMDMYANVDKLNAAARLDLTTGSADADLPNRFIPEYKTAGLDKATIQRIIKGFADAAWLCKENGIDGIDVHALHEGYLLDQFGAKYTNHRTDEYGGSLENRLRFACEIVKAIKEKCGDDYPVMIRYSVESKVRDFGKGIIPADHESVEIGRDFEESKAAVKILAEAGYDALDADNGTYDSWYYAHPPVYMPLNCNLKESMAIKPYTDLPVICAGRMQLDEAAQAISAGKLDFVSIGRQFLADENYLTKVRNDQLEDIIPCISCHLGCMPGALWKNSGAVPSAEMGNCALNPYTNNEKKYELKQTSSSKHFAVIGAGIAGMEFALQAVRRGHTVEVYEKSDRLGGVFNEAACFTFKEKDRDLLQYYATQMKKHNIRIHLNTEITDLSSLNADEIVVATGNAGARQLNIPGFEYAVSALDYLKKPIGDEDHVIIIGGGLTGCEIAYELAMSGKHPVIVEMQDDILKIPGSCMANTSYLRDAFDYYNVPVYTSASTKSISGSDVTIELEDGSTKVIPGSTTIISVGYINGTPFDCDNEHVHVLGDAARVSNLLYAIKSANDLVIEFN